jgi:hypothetical protein
MILNWIPSMVVVVVIGVVRFNPYKIVDFGGSAKNVCHLLNRPPAAAS